FTDSDGEFHGKKLGQLLTRESDFLKKKYQRRSKLKAIAERKPHKAQNIERNNLGRQKLDRRKAKHIQQVRTEVFEAAHNVAKKASAIVHEELKVAIKSKKKRGRDTNRRLSGWVKGLLQEA